MQVTKYGNGRKNTCCWITNSEEETHRRLALFQILLFQFVCFSPIYLHNRVRSQCSDSQTVNENDLNSVCVCVHTLVSVFMFTAHTQAQLRLCDCSSPQCIKRHLLPGLTCFFFFFPSYFQYFTFKYPQTKPALFTQTDLTIQWVNNQHGGESAHQLPPSRHSQIHERLRFQVKCLNINNMNREKVALQLKWS